MSKPEIEAKIEYQEVIGEANPGGYQPIRFTRIKYKASNETHIDIRKFQRAYDDEGKDVFHPTKMGFRFTEREFGRVIKEYTLTPKTYVHPKIIEKSFKLLNSGEFESAVLQAFKCIETAIRKKTGADPEEVGVKLIRNAFNPETGMLTDYNLPKSEREAFAHYIAGAFGFYKNPCSHRDVELDFLTSFDRIVVASDLLKLIDKSKVKQK
ncbi:MAG: TIGR02391 family protein [Chitinophagales bacterium]|nr:TIGR02391 family protein [Chitinophagales bacterium]